MKTPLAVFLAFLAVTPSWAAVDVKYMKYRDSLHIANSSNRPAIAIATQQSGRRHVPAAIAGRRAARAKSGDR
ncbi:MAG TPA: hypothetical protein VGL35_02395 [Rhizomicrobium sp.]|jgi:hypothetical protein